jgi:hypothetical protein
MNGDLSEGGDGIISDAQVYGNFIHDNNLAAGINMDGLEDPLIYNNLIYNNHTSQGIALFQQDGAIVTSGAKIFNNTIVVPTDGRWGILLQDGANVNTEIYNNIIINLHDWRGCIAVESTDQFSSDYNILNDKMSDSGDGSTISLTAWQALGLDANSILADPLSSIFTDPGANDYTLLAGSQAIDAGTDLVDALVMVDIVGNARPMGSGYDMGAYEFVTSTGVHIYTSPLDITLYPNPFNDMVILDGVFSDYEIKVYDAVGSLVDDYTGATPPLTIDLSMLGAGMYFISVQHVSNSLLSVYKIIKQ